EIIPPKYERIYDFGSKGASHFAMVKKSGLYGFINKQGLEVVPPIYDKISYFDRENSNWALVERNGKFGFIDKDGKVVVPVALNDLSKSFHELSDHFNSRGIHLGKLGPVKKFWVSDFTGKYAVIKNKKTWKLGVIDTDFKVVVPVEFKKIMVDNRGNIHVWK
ncbi:MAG: WG repeat-containing protein, partial [Marinoscillum sp.]